MLQWDVKGSGDLTADAPVGETTALWGQGLWAAQAGTYMEGKAEFLGAELRAGCG